MARASATYARVGVEYYKLCAGTEKAILPEFFVEKGEDIAQKHKYVAKADAAFREGGAGGILIGLGGYIALSSDPNTILYKFRVRRPIHTLSSGLAEHLSNVILVKMVVSLGLDDVCLGSDNDSVPNQHRSDWVVNNPLVRIVRAKNADIKQNLHNYHDAWFPREQNVIADKLSKEALDLDRDDCSPEWVRELDEVLGEIRVAFREMIMME